MFSVLTGCVEGDVRIAGGTNYTEGRVEICRRNEWGAVCNRMWTTTDAAVVCRQLHLDSTGIISRNVFLLIILWNAFCDRCTDSYSGQFWRRHWEDLAGQCPVHRD